jgi:hypothetical protein
LSWDGLLPGHRPGETDVPSDVVGQGGSPGGDSIRCRRLAFLGSLRGWILPLRAALVTANVAAPGG